MTAKKCTKKRDARAKLLFCLSNYFFFDVLAAVAIVVAKAPYCPTHGGSARKGYLFQASGLWKGRVGVILVNCNQSTNNKLGIRCFTFIWYNTCWFLHPHLLSLGPIGQNNLAVLTGQGRMACYDKYTIHSFRTCWTTVFLNKQPECRYSVR